MTKSTHSNDTKIEHQRVQGDAPRPQFSLQMGEASLLAMLTAYAYVLAYRYDAGYLSFFGIPRGFVQTDVHDLIVSMVSLLAWLLPSFVVMYWLSSSITNPIHVAVFWLMTGAAIMALAWFAHTLTPKLLLITLGVVAATALHSWRRFERKGGRAVGISIVVATTYILVSLHTAAYAHGRHEASKHREFLVYQASSKGASEDGAYVVVRPQLSSYLCVGVDLEAELLLPSIHVIDPLSLSVPARRHTFSHLRMQSDEPKTANGLKQE